MSFRLTVDCPHGVKVTTADDAAEECTDDEFRLYVRSILLACPRCRRDAEGFIQEPGP